jgi:hypothetical protein
VTETTPAATATSTATPTAISSATVTAAATVNVGLHYGNYRFKLVPFEAQKNIFYA